MDRSSEWCGARPTRRNRPRSRGPNGQPVDAPGHIADVTSHLAIPNSGVRRYAAALQSLVSAGVRDRLARAVRRLCARGNGFEPSVPGTKGPVFVAEGEL